MDHPTDLDSDEEWEYEYDDTATEVSCHCSILLNLLLISEQTFYLNLDLTTLNGPVRPPRRRQGEPSNHDPPEPTDDVPSANVNPDAYTPLDSAETETPNRERIQILGLHTSNPVVSYHNQIFSCSWADQIGTELVFSHPDTDPDADALSPLQQGPGYDLLAANSVKILGRKANITSGSGTELFEETMPDIDRPAGPSSAQMVGSTSVPRRAVPPSYQAEFIQRFQDLKRAKGETDTVRTVMSTRRNVNVAYRLSGWIRTEAQLAQIHELQRRVEDGDLEAYETLERMIAEHAEPVQES